MHRVTRTIFVGDVHGCREELDELLEACAFREGDRLVLLGDLVAKGPDSPGVMRRVRELGALAVLGNHDAHVLAWHARGRAEWVKAKPGLRRVLESLSEEDFAFLRGLPRWLRLGDAGGAGGEIIAVHAGLVPGLPLEAQDPDVVINLRSLKADGTPSSRIEDGVPWASRWPGPERIFFGHDAVRGLQRYPHAMGLDTGCVYGGELSAWILPEERLVQVKAHRAHKSVDKSPDAGPRS